MFSASPGDSPNIMRLSFSTNAFVQHSVFDAVREIGEAGYSGVELLADVPHLFADTFSDDDLDNLRKLLESMNLTVANVNANTAAGFYGKEFWEPVFEPSLAHPDSRLRRWRLDYSRRCVDMAAYLGSPVVSVTSGRMVPGITPDESLKILKDSLGELLEHAERRDVRIGMEYEPGLLVEKAEELADLIREMHSDSFGANLDLGHSHVLGEDPEPVIELLGSKIFHIHLEDIRARKHYHLIPGEGDLDFGRIFRALESQGYSGFVTVELYTYPQRPRAAAEAALRYLDRFTPGFGRTTT